MGNNCHDVIVVGGDHYNTLWVCRSLGMAGFCPTVIVINPLGNYSFITKCKYLKSSYVVNDEEAMIAILRHLSFADKIVLFSSSDTCSNIIDEHFDELKGKYILPNCGNKQGNLSYWMDKKRMNDLAVDLGFNVPWTKTVDYNDINWDDVIFPCIVKPLNSSKGKKTDFSICKTKDELKKALDSLKRNQVPCLLQEYVMPEFEISILCMRIRNNNVNLIPGLQYKIGTCKSTRNMGMPTFACVQKDVSPYINSSIVNQFIERIDYEGLYSIEYFVSKGKAYFLEINLRVDGDLFLYTTSGVNMPEMWTKSMLGVNDVNFSPRLKTTYGMTEISYIKYLDWKHPIKVLKEWWKTDCYSIFSWTDIKPFIYKFIYEFH